MTLWHFFGAFLVLAAMDWAAAIHGVGRTWWSVVAALAPVTAALAWLGLWVRMDWERSLLDQAVWILAGHAGLLFTLAVVAVATWRLGRRGSRHSLANPSGPGGQHRVHR